MVHAVTGERIGTAVPLRSRKPRGDRPPLESAIVAAILQRFALMEDVVVWRNNTGMTTSANGRKFAFGLCEGGSDLVGIVRRVGGFVQSDELVGFQRCAFSYGTPAPFGQFFALEVKQPGKKPTEAQRRFLEMVKRMGGAAGWCDSVDGAVAFVEGVRT